MRWILASAMLCLPAAVQAEDLCGRGDASHGPLAMTVIIAPPHTNPHSPYVSVKAPDPEGSFDLGVHYRPTEAGLGPPAQLLVTLRVPLPAPGEPGSHQLEWRAGSGAWSNPGYWFTPERSADDAANGVIRHVAAQSGRGALGFGPELLEALARGTRVELRSLDRSGEVVAGGSVDYPAAAPILAMYDEARAEAVARLGPCGPPAMVIRPAPPPPRPWLPEGEACRIVQSEARWFARRGPRPGARVVDVEQIVDCEARTVTRVFTLADRDVRLADFAQQTADRQACVAAVNQTMYERDGWSFRAEARGPDGRAATAVARVACPPRSPHNDEPHERGRSDRADAPAPR